VKRRCVLAMHDGSSSITTASPAIASCISVIRDIRLNVVCSFGIHYVRNIFTTILTGRFSFR